MPSKKAKTEAKTTEDGFPTFNDFYENFSKGKQNLKNLYNILKNAYHSNQKRIDSSQKIIDNDNFKSLHRGEKKYQKSLIKQNKNILGFVEKNSEKIDPKDPNAPKRPKNGFMFFTDEKRKVVKAENKDATSTEISKIIGEMWSALKIYKEDGKHTERKKDPIKNKIIIKRFDYSKKAQKYLDKASKDKKRYEKEFKKYQKSLEKKSKKSSKKAKSTKTS